jgi:hypothetical protein
MGCEATCAAPAPITAPPQVQAHNFAMAILTDIGPTLFQGFDAIRAIEDQMSGSRIGYWRQMQKICLRATALTTLLPRNAREMAVWAPSVPFEDKADRRVNE